MAQAQGLSEATVRRIWKQHNLKPHRVKRFQLSRDPKFLEKLYDIVGLYRSPRVYYLLLLPDRRRALVLQCRGGMRCPPQRS